MWRLLCIAVKSRTFAAEFENNKNVTIQTQKHFHGYESAFFCLRRTVIRVKIFREMP